MRARFKNECFMCQRTIYPGDPIGKTRSNKWVHRVCADYARAKEAINAGSTYRSQRRSDWKMGKSPSSQSRRLG